MILPSFLWLLQVFVNNSELFFFVIHLLILLLFFPVNMLKFPVSHAISLDFGYDFGDFEDIKEMLRNFSTKNMRIDFLSKAFTEKGILVCSLVLVLILCTDFVFI